MTDDRRPKTDNRWPKSEVTSFPVLPLAGGRAECSEAQGGCLTSDV